MNKVYGIVCIIIGIGLLVLTIKKPANKENDPMAADFKGYLGSGIFIIVGLFMLFRD